MKKAKDPEEKPITDGCIPVTCKNTISRSYIITMRLIYDREVKMQDLPCSLSERRRNLWMADIMTSCQPYTDGDRQYTR